MALLDRLQHMPKEEQVVSAACFFVLLYQRYYNAHGLSVSELLAMSERLMSDAEGRRKEFRAAELYIDNEL